MSGTRFKLSVMMFLEFFIWGAWLPASFGYFGEGALGFSPTERMLLNFAFPVSAIIAMFFANQFVDRMFAAEKFLAISHFIGGLAFLGFGFLSQQAFAGDVPQPANFWLFFACMAIHCLFYVPTISVTNSIAFANMTDPQKEFGPIRLWGTIGWIAASWPFIFILLDWQNIPTVEKAGGLVPWLGTALGKGLSGMALNRGIAWAFLTAGMASILLAVFSLTLPHTPPKKSSEELALFKAASFLAKPFLFILFIVTFIDATIHDGFFFFAFTYLGKVGVPSNWIQPAMSVGQIAEIVTMAFLGYVLKTFGWRTTMIVGIMGHCVRFAVFALVPNPYCAVAVNVLHGICYAFFFATMYIMIDEFFPKDVRTSAQGLFNFLVLGMGPIASRFIWEYLQTVYTTGEGAAAVVDYSKLLLYPSGAALGAAILMLLFFHPPETAGNAPVKPPAAH
jgi:uncharacterized membrane protein YwzB